MLLTLTQAANSLGLSVSTLREQIHRGRLAATKPGRDWLVDEVEVERYRLESKGQAGRPFNTAPPKGAAVHPVPKVTAVHHVPHVSAVHPMPRITNIREIKPPKGR